jgi:hypothetical protein
MLSYIPIAYRYYQDKLARRGSEPPLPSIGAIDPPARWFHSIDFGDGQVTRGTNPNFRLRGMADIVFRSGVAGKPFSISAHGTAFIHSRPSAAAPPAFWRQTISAGRAKVGEQNRDSIMRMRD